MILPLSQWMLALVLAMLIAGVALRVRALATSGAIAAIVLGTVIVGMGGWWPGVILVAFFASSSALSRLTHAYEPQARGARRDWVQVLANGWGLLIGAIAYGITGWSPWLLFGIGAIAAATADTWSSEIGRTSPSPPRLITTLRAVAPGTSGAVSIRGLLASATGAGCIALITTAAIANGMKAPIGLVPAGITTVLAGLLGGLVDSLLGATVQERRWCDACDKATEANPHRCGTPTRITGGVPGFNNDVVNLICVLAGALTALVSGIL